MTILLSAFTLITMECEPKKRKGCRMLFILHPLFILIHQDCSYVEALSMTVLVPLCEHCKLLRDKLFNPILCNPLHKLYSLLPSKNECNSSTKVKNWSSRILKGETLWWTISDDSDWFSWRILVFEKSGKMWNSKTKISKNSLENCSFWVLVCRRLVNCNIGPIFCL